MKQLTNIGSDAYQVHSIPFGDYEIILKLRFFGTIQHWVMDLEYRDTVITGTKLSVGTLHFRSNNMPFDFVVYDYQVTGLDPYKLDAFDSGQYVIVMLEADEMEERRGYPVEQ